MAEIQKPQRVQFQISQFSKSALMFGATGMIGKELLKAIVTNQAYRSLTSFGRREIKATHPKLKHYVVDFNHLENYKHLLKGNDLYIALGTTMKSAGSKEAFRQVDFEFVFQIAKFASLNGVDQVIVISSVGADTDSPFFYTKVKGEMEQAVRKLPFWAVHIFRPSLLLGDRDEERILERLAVRLSRGAKYLAGRFLGKYQPVEPDVVAKAMVKAAQQTESGTFVYEGEQIEKLIIETEV